MNVPSPTDTDRRTAILDAAVESFGKLGYYGTSLQRIATEVGLTKPACCITWAARRDCSSWR